MRFLNNNSKAAAAAGERAQSRAADLALTARLKYFFQLTKPSIMLLILVTGATALILEGSFIVQPDKFLLFMLGLYLTGGAANALNQYFERDIDSRMTRTSHRRPLPTGRLTPTSALVFSLSIGVAGIVLFAFVFNWLTAALALGTILFYSLFYTLVLKPTTPQNIVIGGIAGAMAPVGAWTAATGATALTPWILFLIVLLWTPPHFWALAICFRDDYKKSGLPMLPVVKGTSRTLFEIMMYTMILVPLSLTYTIFATGGWFYLVTATILGVLFFQRVYIAVREKTHPAIWRVFGFSILYLFGLFLSMIVDKYVAVL